MMTVSNERNDPHEKKYIVLSLVLGAAAILASCASAPSSSSADLSSNSNVASSATSEVSSQARVFTLEELAQYNGDNGSDAYVAVNGVVYDVTNASDWENGWHKDMHLAGTDATAVFADSPHSEAFLASLPIVGTMAA